MGPSTRELCIYVKLNVFFLYRSCKLHRVWLTVSFRPVNPHIYTCSRGTLQYVWRRIRAQDADYWKTVHNGVQPLIFMVVFIPEDNLTYRPLPCNSIHTLFLDYICLYEVMVFQQASLLLLRLADTVSPTWLIIFSTRCNFNDSNVPSEMFWSKLQDSFIYLLHLSTHNLSTII